jgi:hypothetical protein
MMCAIPRCGGPSLGLRSGDVDVLGEAGDAGECQIIPRRVIWLCDACSGIFNVETWRPPARHQRPARSSRTNESGNPAESWN